MKKQKFNTFGVEIEISVPETVEEFDTLAGRQGAALEEAIKNVVYRGTLADIRDITLHGNPDMNLVGLEESEGIERLKEQTRTRKDEEGNEEPVFAWAEAELKFFKRICDTRGVEPAHYQTQIQAVADAVNFDPSRPERVSSGPRTVAKTYLKLAKSIVEQGRAEASAAKLGDLLGREVEPNEESIARAIAENEARERKTLSSKY